MVGLSGDNERYLDVFHLQLALAHVFYHLIQMGVTHLHTRTRIRPRTTRPDAHERQPARACIHINAYAHASVDAD